ncbi:MAG: hypothetical protein NZM08_07545, partial [Chitinophagales bacterium]|nr:hypothetical protein [Chitinophagales bacterium]
QALHEDGRVFVSSTRLGGHIFLRAAILAFRTHLKTVDLLLELLAQKKEKLLADLATQQGG